MCDSAPDPDPAVAVDYARRLANDLDPRLRYHHAEHTFREVLPAARTLAADAGVAGTVLDLLVVAAAFHDLGYLALSSGTRRDELGPLRDALGGGHEHAGVVLMRRTLAPLGYAEAWLDRIGRMILATRLPQRPASLEERLLADADLALLGSRTFPVRNEHLRLERVALGGRPIPRAEWARRQADFLLRHRYASDVAERRYGAGRARNERILRAYQRSGRTTGSGRTSLSGPPGRSYASSRRDGT